MRKLNQVYDVLEDPEKTKSRIILCAVRLFALQGYDTVSMKQLASELKVQPGAIYNHYSSKEAILNYIIDETGRQLDYYYQILEEANMKASSFREIVDNMFAELLNITSEFIYYGLAAAQNTQFIFEKSRELFCDKFVVYGHEVMKRQFDIAVEKGFLHPCDTRALASLYGGSTIAFNQIQVGKFNGYYKNLDTVAWYQREKDFILEIAELYNT